MKTTKTALILALFAAYPLIATAQDLDDKPMPAERTARLLERYGAEGIDANGDGELTREEIREFFASRNPGRRRGADDGDDRRGARRPGPAGPRAGLQRLIDRMDGLAAQPVPSSESPSYRRADADSDGEVTAAEWQAFQSTTRGRMLERLMEAVPDADADKDGALSDTELTQVRAIIAAEHRAAVLLRNPEADLDGDGTLSPAELEAFNAARRAELLIKHPAADLDGDGVLSEEEARSLNDGRRERPGRRDGAERKTRRGERRRGEPRPDVDDLDLDLGEDDEGSDSDE